MSPDPVLDSADDHLRDVFRRQAPRPTVDYVAAREHVDRRAGQIRRRRAAANATAGVAVLMLGLAAFAALRRDPANVEVRSPSTTEASLPTTTVAPTITTATTPSTAATTSASTTVVEPTTQTEPTDETEPNEEVGVTTASTGGQTPTTRAQRPSTTPPPVATTPRTSLPATSTTGEDGEDEEEGGSQTTSVSSARGEQTYGSVGGSIRVRWADGRMSLISESPASGWRVKERSVEPREITLEFEKDGATDRIRLKLVNGIPERSS